ncbi:MAG TPA: carbon-nitrogen family hydrolase [Desulfobacterales bacterium]
MKIASIQMAVIEGDKAATIAGAVERIARCRGADLVVLPEIWNVGFMSFDRYIDEAETADGPTLTAMRAVARKIGAYLHTGSFVEEDRGRYYNSSYLLSPGGEILANYRKIHLFGYNSRETQILTPGERIVVADTPLGKVAMATCFDLRFPELFRAMIDLGAEIFLICSAWPYPRLEHWLLLNRVRAFENQAFLVSANATGMNQGVQFVGHSRIVDPWGTVMAGAGDGETILRTEFDLQEVQAARKEFPGLAGRVAWLRNP